LPNTFRLSTCFSAHRYTTDARYDQRHRRVAQGRAPRIELRSLALPDKPSVAVLPFTNMSGDREQEFVSDGVAEDVITALSRYPSLFVIARNSSFTFEGRAVDVRQVGRERERVRAWRTALRCRPI
jgi:TolB-like protein